MSIDMLWLSIAKIACHLSSEDKATEIMHQLEARVKQIMSVDNQIYAWDFKGGRYMMKENEVNQKSLTLSLLLF